MFYSRNNLFRNNYCRNRNYSHSNLLAIAQVAVVPNSTASPPYGVNIKFEPASGQIFSLNLGGDKTISGIPYSLYFLGDTVPIGEQIPWNGMTAGNNQQTISVTGINSGTAKAAPEGDYSDTIMVTITPIDT